MQIDLMQRRLFHNRETDIFDFLNPLEFLWTARERRFKSNNYIAFRYLFSSTFLLEAHEQIYTVSKHQIRARDCSLPGIVNQLYALLLSLSLLVSAGAFSHEYDEPPHHDELMSMRRQSSPNHGILKVASMAPSNQRYPSQSDYDDGHMQVI